jgi:hypothetical protein
MTGLPACQHRGLELRPGEIECFSPAFADGRTLRPVAVCLAPCPHARADGRRPEPEGLGDWLAHAFRWIGLAGDCDGCARRRKRLNDLVPFHKRGET